MRTLFTFFVLLLFCFTGPGVIKGFGQFDGDGFASSSFSTSSSLDISNVVNTTTSFASSNVVPASSNDTVNTTTKASGAMNNYDVKWYSLDIELDDKSNFIKGSLTVLARVLEPGMDYFIIELASGMTVDSVKASNGGLLDFFHSGDLIMIDLTTAPDPGDLVNIAIYYQGYPYDGLYNAHDDNWNIDVTWSLSEPFAAMEWFPCKQDLADKADSVRVFVTVPDGLMAGSNGLLRNVTSLPGGRSRYEWYSNYPIAYYLISVALADYREYSFYTHFAENDSMLVQNYIYDTQEYLDQNKAAMEKTSGLLQFFSDKYSLYPFHEEKYGHCIVPKGSYMEHQTMSTMRDFNFRIVAHEMAHQWFGDQVTCSSWQDIWINEGFASYSEYLALQELSPAEAGPWLEDAMERALREPEGSVYIPFEEATDIGRIFSYNLSYRKGALLLHMLRHLINADEVYFDIMKEFQYAYKDSVASGLDFMSLAEDVSGLQLASFFDQWYFGKGYPSFDIKWSWRDGQLTIRSSQTTSSGDTPLFKVPLEFRLSLPGRDSLLLVFQDQPYQEFVIDVADDVLSLELDPNLKLLKGESQVSSVPDVSGANSQILRLYPNPAAEYLVVETSPGDLPLEIIVLDMPGRIQFSYKPSGQSSYSPGANSPSFIVLSAVSSLPPGIYFVQARFNWGISTASFIKQ